MQRKSDGFVRLFGERTALGNCHDYLVVKHAWHASMVCAVCAAMGHMPADAGEAACKIDCCYSSHRSRQQHQPFSASTMQLDLDMLHEHAKCLLDLRRSWFRSLLTLPSRLPSRALSRALSARHPGTTSTVQCSLYKDLAPVPTAVWPKQTVNSTLERSDLHSKTSPLWHFDNLRNQGSSLAVGDTSIMYPC